MDKDYILHKYLNGSASEEEIEMLRNSPEYSTYVKIAEAATELQPPSPSSDANYEVIKLKQKDQKPVRKIRPFAAVFKIAAILAVIIACYVYFDTRDTTITTNIAEKRDFKLPDNSEVTLNANSSLRYNKNKWIDERTLELKGEAFFKVSKGNKFSVKTPQGEVSVLGTQFNVFVRQNTFHVNCYEGLVSVAFSDTLIKLPAGSRLKIENGVLTENILSDDAKVSWLGDESSFNNARITFVLDELKRQYPINLTANFSNADLRFTGTFTHNDLDIALRSICDPLHLAFTIEEESVTIYDKKGQ